MMAAPSRKKSRPSAVLFLLALAVGTLIYYEYNNVFWRSPPVQPPAAEPLDVTLPGPLPAFEMPPLVDFAATTERPLFMPDRRPPEPEDGPIETQPEAAGISLQLVVSGIALSDAGNYVLVQRQGGGDVIRLREGEDIDGWSVQAILPKTVIFERDEATQEVQLRQPTERQAPPKERARPDDRSDSAGSSRPGQVRARDRQSGGPNRTVAPVQQN